MPDYDFGLINYADQVVSGEMEGVPAMMFGYGLYLLGGGTPEGFMELTHGDVQVLIQTHESLESRRRTHLMKDLYTMFTGQEMM